MSHQTVASSEICQLNPQARATSTIISIGTGFIIAGVTGGHRVAFHAAWVCYFPILRIIMTGAWFTWEAIRLRRAAGGDQFYRFYRKVPGLRFFVSFAKRFDTPFFRMGQEDAGVNGWGWAGWLWVVLYVPIMNTMWLVGNWNEASGTLKWARSVSVAVSALPLTIDTKARYGDAIGKLLGEPARWLFTALSALTCLYLGLLSALLFFLALPDWPSGAWKCVQLVLAYTLYAYATAFWTFGSFSFQTPHDEGLGVANREEAWEGFGTAVFGILTTLLPAAWIASQFSEPSPGVGLKEYTTCDSVYLWRKLVALFP